MIDALLQPSSTLGIVSASALIGVAVACGVLLLFVVLGGNDDA